MSFQRRTRCVTTSSKKSSPPDRSCPAPSRSPSASHGRRRSPCKRPWRTDAWRCRRAGAPRSPISRRLSSGCTTARTRPRACDLSPKSATRGSSADEPPVLLRIVLRADAHHLRRLGRHYGDLQRSTHAATGVPGSTSTRLGGNGLLVVFGGGRGGLRPLRG